jgi:hypothetical protein
VGKNLDEGDAGEVSERATGTNVMKNGNARSSKDCGNKGELSCMRGQHDGARATIEKDPHDTFFSTKTKKEPQYIHRNMQLQLLSKLQAATTGQLCRHLAKCQWRRFFFNFKQNFSCL